jgi:hypothetical protein
MRMTSWPVGVRVCNRNIQRWGMKLRVTPLSGLYKSIFIRLFLAEFHFRGS